MKIAEALVERATLKKRLAEVRERITANLMVDEDEKPEEDVVPLYNEANQIMERMSTLTIQINRSNAQALIAYRDKDGLTIMEGVAWRDELDQRIGVLREMVQGLKPERQYHRRSYGLEARTKDQIKQVPTTTVHVWREQHDQVAKQRAELDMALQHANWHNDLVEE